MNTIISVLGISITNSTKDTMLFMLLLTIWVTLTQLILVICNAYKTVILNIIYSRNGDRNWVNKNMFILNIGAIILGIGIIFLVYEITIVKMFSILGVKGISNLWLIITNIYFSIGSLYVLITGIKNNTSTIEIWRRSIFIAYYYISEYVVWIIWLVVFWLIK